MKAPPPSSKNKEPRNGVRFQKVPESVKKMAPRVPVSTYVRPGVRRYREVRVSALGCPCNPRSRNSCAIRTTGVGRYRPQGVRRRYVELNMCT